MQPQLIIAFSFGVTFVVTLIVLAIRFPNPTAFQYTVFRTILSLAAAGAAAMIPGFLNVELSATQAFLLRAGGALAVFVIVFFRNPAALLAQQDVDQKSATIPLPPATLPTGAPFPHEQEQAFRLVWEALVMLDMAGEDLWRNISC